MSIIQYKNDTLIPRFWLFQETLKNFFIANSSDIEFGSELSCKIHDRKNSQIFISGITSKCMPSQHAGSSLTISGFGGPDIQMAGVSCAGPAYSCNPGGTQTVLFCFHINNWRKAGDLRSTTHMNPDNSLIQFSSYQK